MIQTTLQTSWSNRALLGLACGMGIMLANLFVLKWVAHWMLSGNALPATLSMAVLTFKFLFSIVAVWFVLKNLPVQPTALGIGIVSVPLLAAALAGAKGFGA